MNQVATRHPGSGLPALSEPNWTGWMRSTLRDFRNPHPDLGPPPVPAAVADEAKRAIPALEAALRPASLDDWRSFLLPLLATVGNAPDRSAFAGKVSAIATALNDVPAAALSPNAQRDVMRVMRFFPSPADLLPILRPLYAERVADLAALRRIAAAPSALPEQRQAPTPEQIADVQAKARAVMAEASKPDPKGPPPRALPLSEGALLAHYRRLAAQGSEAAAVRVARIEERLSLDA